MDILIILIIIAFSLINAVMRYRKEKERKEASGKGMPEEPQISPVEEFLKILRGEQPASQRPLPRVVAAPAPVKRKIPVREKPARGPESEMVKSTVATDFRGAFTRKPLREKVPVPGAELRRRTAVPPKKKAPLFTPGINAASARKGIVMAEILAPPIAKRRQAAGHARRIF